MSMQISIQVGDQPPRWHAQPAVVAWVKGCESIEALDAVDFDPEVAEHAARRKAVLGKACVLAGAA